MYGNVDIDSHECKTPYITYFVNPSFRPVCAPSGATPAANALPRPPAAP